MIDSIDLPHRFPPHIVPVISAETVIVFACLMNIPLLPVVRTIIPVIVESSPAPPTASRLLTVLKKLSISERLTLIELLEQSIEDEAAELAVAG